VGEASDMANISQRISALEALDTLSPTTAEALNSIDDDLTAILVKADQKCWVHKNTPWSPELHEAFLEHRYWNLCCSELRKDRDYSAAYNVISTLLPPAKTQLLPDQTVSK